MGSTERTLAGSHWMTNQLLDAQQEVGIRRLLLGTSIWWHKTPVGGGASNKNLRAGGKRLKVRNCQIKRHSRVRNRSQAYCGSCGARGSKFDSCQAHQQPRNHFGARVAVASTIKTSRPSSPTLEAAAPTVTLFG